MKKFCAALLAALMALSLAACGGGGGETAAPDASPDGGAESGGNVNITIFNSKSEIQSQFEEMAEEYSKATGVGVEVYFSSDTVAAHMATRYASNDPYTLAMVDAKDVYSLGPEHAVDMSGEDWVANTNYAVSVGDQVMGFPVCVEARGLMYNADAIEAITGEPFVPSDYATLDAFKGLLETLVAGGMEAPVGIMKEDWSLAGHFLAEVYEEQDDVFAYVDGLYDGTSTVADNEKFNALMDYFDVMKQYNYAAASPIAAEREVSEQYLAEGKIAFMFGGNWDWAMINSYDYSENLGMMPVPQNLDDGDNQKLVGGGSKFFFIDSSEFTSDEQRQAAKDFLNWLVFSEDGNKFITEDCALVPAFSNIAAENLDPLGASVKEYADAGNLIDNYNYLPDDHYSLMGAELQKYLAGQQDRAQLAAAIEQYWASTTPVER
ncbi:MAG: carbohydrate ABC transporter substrate-binding protein [Oscillibacter sp.]|nr:carbohydrate ABC transporter substrate-binding protein [Oscillibacter sp.]